MDDFIVLGPILALLVIVGLGLLWGRWLARRDDRRQQIEIGEVDCQRKLLNERRRLERLEDDLGYSYNYHRAEIERIIRE